MSIKTIPGNVFAFILVALLIIAIVVLVALGHPIPGIFPTLASVLVGVGGGASLPGLTGATPSTPAATPSAPTAAPTAPVAGIPTPAAWTTAPAPGVGVVQP